MYRCACGREFKIEQHYNMHKVYCKGPRYCQNPDCNKLLLKLDQKKFCSTRCSTIVTGKGRKHTEKTKNKISISRGGTGKLTTINCSYCGKITNNPKYCSIKCTRMGKIPEEYNKKNLKDRKSILWKEQKFKCNKCNYNLYNLEIGPYEIHHMDGDSKNKMRENEELLCCNCHSMTKNYRFKGRNHTSKSKQKISKARKNNIPS